jgi:hypothetical protein
MLAPLSHYIFSQWAVHLLIGLNQITNDIYNHVSHTSAMSMALKTISLEDLINPSETSSRSSLNKGHPFSLPFLVWKGPRNAGG